MIPFFCEISRISKSIETENRLGVARGYRGKWGVTANRYGIFFLRGRICSKNDCGDGDGCTTSGLYEKP